MLDPKLKAIANKIQNEETRANVIKLLEKPRLKIGEKTYSGPPLDTSPAGLSHHHNYPRGYVEHVVATANLALALCDCVEKVYHGKANRDLVIAGVLLHDIYKPVTYVENEKGRYSSSQLADHLDHLTLATSELIRRGFPLELIHIVAAHHGECGPVRPRTVEALICHLADFTDSRLNGEVLSAAAYLTRKAVGQELYGLGSKEAFEIVHSKSVEGWEGVKKAAERIARKRKAHKT